MSPSNKRITTCFQRGAITINMFFAVFSCQSRVLTKKWNISEITEVKTVPSLRSFWQAVKAGHIWHVITNHFFFVQYIWFLQALFAGSIPEIIDIVKTFPKYNGTYVSDRGRRHVQLSFHFLTLNASPGPFFCRPLGKPISFEVSQTFAHV